MGGPILIMYGWLVGWSEFNVPFQHKYGYIRDERPAVKSYPLTQRRKGGKKREGMPRPHAGLNNLYVV